MNRLLAFLLSFGLALCATTTPAHAQSGTTPPKLHAGWNLVAGTGQMLLGGAFGSTVYTIQPGDASYQNLPGQAPLKPGLGYWANLTSDSVLSLRAGDSHLYQIAAPAGQSFMVGDPSGTQPAVVTGADSVLTYDPVSGYQQTTTLQPGQGAWVMSAAGGTITVSPQGNAPAAGTANTRTISGSKGYSFTVPADWQREPAPADLQALDAFVVSPDVSGYATALVTNGPTQGGVNVIRGLTNLNTDELKKDPSAKVLVAPTPFSAELPGADNAAYTITTYTGSITAKTHVDLSVMAYYGGNLFILDVDFYADSLTANQDAFWQIANSLHFNG